MHDVESKMFTLDGSEPFATGVVVDPAKKPVADAVIVIETAD